MKILMISVLTSLTLVVGASAWAQTAPSPAPAPQASPAPAPLSKKERIKLCQQKQGAPLEPAESQTLSLDRPGGAVSRPTLIHSVPPSGAAGTRGEVIIEATIDEDGCVRQLKLVKTGGQRLDAAALAAMKQWVFLPAMKDGRPVAVLYDLSIESNHF